MDDLEKSSAHPGRPAIRVEGLLAFLRKEYYRRNGVYSNGAMNEQ